MCLIFEFEDRSRKAIAKGASIEKLVNLPVRERIGRAKSVPYDKYKDEFEKIKTEIGVELDDLVAEAKEG